MAIVIQVLIFVIWIYTILIVARILFEMFQSFVPDWRPRGAMVLVAEMIYTPTDPPLRLLRSALPMLNLGQIRFDLSPMVLLLICWIITIALNLALQSVT